MSIIKIINCKTSIVIFTNEIDLDVLMKKDLQDLLLV